MANFQTRLVTVFGGSGFVGAQVVRSLARLGWRVRVAVRRPTLAYALQPLGDVGQIQIVRCDIRSRRSVEAALEGASAAVNLVGILHEGGGRRFADVHAEGARHVAEACAARDISTLVHVSAIGADPQAKSAYARTKGEGEAAVRAAVPSAVILRPSIVFGPGDGFLNRFAAMAGFAPALPLIGGGHTRFQPVYVADVAAAVARAVEDPRTAGRTFELGGPATYSFREILEYILRETNRTKLLLPVPFPVARALGDVAGLAAIIGLTPPLTRDQAIQLESDNVVAEDAEGLEALGVTPTGMEAIAPAYLWRYRRGGQFAESPPLAFEAVRDAA